MKKTLNVLSAGVLICSVALASSLTAETPTRGGTLIATLNSNVRNLNSAV